MPMKIWIFNHYATGFFKNRGGRHYWFAKFLKEMGFEPVVFCANTFHQEDDYIDTNGEKYHEDCVDGIPFVFVKTKQASGNGIDRVLNMYLFYRNLIKTARLYGAKRGFPEVILASSVHPLTLVAGIKIGKKYNIPCICEMRDLWPEAIFAHTKLKKASLIGRLLEAGEYWIYRRGDALVFTVEGYGDYLRDQGWTREQGGKIDMDKTHYINNGLDLEAYDRNIGEHVLDDEDLSGELGDPGDKFNITYTGSIRFANNVGSILDTAKLLNDEKDIQFLIYGDGEERKALEKRISEEKISNVRIKGFVNKRYIPYILSKSSVNLLNYNTKIISNWSRGSSNNKLFEYMASGRPIISNVKMGYSIIDKYNCGYELNGATPKELADMIRKIKNLPKSEYERLCKNAREGARDFDFRILTGKLKDVVESVTGKNRK